MEKERTATFIGHSDCFGLSEEKVTAEIEKLILQGVSVYLNGGQGGFDRLCGYCVWKLKKKYPHIESYIVIPYLSFNIFNKEIFDAVIYPEGLEELYFKSAIIAKNDYLINNSAYALCYVRHNWGGASKSYEKAKSKDLKLINIGRVDKIAKK